MIVFGEYARYYDLLYRDKDYQVETEFVAGLIRKYQPGATRLLELGCGTGRHAECLAADGFSVHGVDHSQEMLAVAEERLASMPPAVAQFLAFSPGDVRSVRVAAHFDAVISLFHVMSYQVGNDDLAGAFAAARAHLQPGGIFLFDCWYGPAVFHSPPEVRVKRLNDEQVEVLRIAEPDWDVNHNLVTVNYEINVSSTATGQSSRFKESHRMRYLFLPEIEAMLLQHGFCLVEACEWMTAREPDRDSWNLCVVAKVVRE